MREEETKQKWKNMKMAKEKMKNEMKKKKRRKETKKRKGCKMRKEAGISVICDINGRPNLNCF